ERDSPIGSLRSTFPQTGWLARAEQQGFRTGGTFGKIDEQTRRVINPRDWNGHDELADMYSSLSPRTMQRNVGIDKIFWNRARGYVPNFSNISMLKNVFPLLSLLKNRDKLVDAMLHGLDYQPYSYHAGGHRKDRLEHAARHLPSFMEDAERAKSLYYWDARIGSRSSAMRTSLVHGSFSDNPLHEAPEFSYVDSHTRGEKRRFRPSRVFLRDSKLEDNYWIRGNENLNTYGLGSFSATAFDNNNKKVLVNADPFGQAWADLGHNKNGNRILRIGPDPWDFKPHHGESRPLSYLKAAKAVGRVLIKGSHPEEDDIFGVLSMLQKRIPVLNQYVNLDRIGNSWHHVARLLEKGNFDNPISPPSVIRPNYYEGYIPNFANPLLEAIQRESKSVPMSTIRVGQDSSLRGVGNEAGLGIYNTINEPGGLNQGIGRSRSLGINPKYHGMSGGFVPNFETEMDRASKAIVARVYAPPATAQSLLTRTIPDRVLGIVQPPSPPTVAIPSVELGIRAASKLRESMGRLIEDAIKIGKAAEGRGITDISGKSKVLMANISNLSEKIGKIDTNMPPPSEIVKEFRSLRGQASSLSTSFKTESNALKYLRGSLTQGSAAFSGRGFDQLQIHGSEYAKKNLFEASRKHIGLSEEAAGKISSQRISEISGEQAANRHFAGLVKDADTVMRSTESRMGRVAQIVSEGSSSTLLRQAQRVEALRQKTTKEIEYYTGTGNEGEVIKRTRLLNRLNPVINRIEQKTGTFESSHGDYIRQVRSRLTEKEQIGVNKFLKSQKTDEKESAIGTAVVMGIQKRLSMEDMRRSRDIANEGLIAEGGFLNKLKGRSGKLATSMLSATGLLDPVKAGRIANTAMMSSWIAPQVIEGIGATFTQGPDQVTNARVQRGFTGVGQGSATVATGAMIAASGGGPGMILGAGFGAVGLYQMAHSIFANLEDSTKDLAERFQEAAQKSSIFMQSIDTARGASARYADILATGNKNEIRQAQIASLESSRNIADPTLRKMYSERFIGNNFGRELGDKISARELFLAKREENSLILKRSPIVMDEAVKNLRSGEGISNVERVELAKTFFAGATSDRSKENRLRAAKTFIESMSGLDMNKKESRLTSFQKYDPTSFLGDYASLATTSKTTTGFGLVSAASVLGDLFGGRRAKTEERNINTSDILRKAIGTGQLTTSETENVRKFSIALTSGIISTEEYDLQMREIKPILTRIKISYEDAEKLNKEDNELKKQLVEQEKKFGEIYLATLSAAKASILINRGLNTFGIQSAQRSTGMEIQNIRFSSEVMRKQQMETALAREGGFTQSELAYREERTKLGGKNGPGEIQYKTEVALESVRNSLAEEEAKLPSVIADMINSAVREGKGWQAIPSSGVPLRAETEQKNLEDIRNMSYEDASKKVKEYLARFELGTGEVKAAHIKLMQDWNEIQMKRERTIGEAKNNVEKIKAGSDKETGDILNVRKTREFASSLRATGITGEGDRSSLISRLTSGVDNPE
ncbi:MAG: hypothetical protein WCO18_00735, partial [bacterium]